MDIRERDDLVLREVRQYHEFHKYYGDAEIQVGDILFDALRLTSQVMLHHETREGEETIRIDLPLWIAKRVKERLSQKAKITIRAKGWLVNPFAEYEWRNGARSVWSNGTGFEEIIIQRKTTAEEMLDEIRTPT